MTKRRLGQRGQGIVEFAVIFPIFAILIFAVIDGGFVMGRYNGANHAATVGARFGAVQSDDADTVAAAVFAQVKQYAPGKASDYVNDCNFSAHTAAVCVQWLAGPNGEAAGDIGSSIRVALKYHYGGLTPLVKGFGGWDITACIAERQEQAVTIPPGDQTHIGNSTSCSGAGVPTPTNTPVPTKTPVPTNTPVPTRTNTPVPTRTNTPAPTRTNTPLPTRTNTPVPTRTNTPVPTATPCPDGGHWEWHWPPGWVWVCND